MSNFIFKSQWTFKKISNQLEIILSELRHQRQDNVTILYKLDRLLVDKRLQKQVDQYFEDDQTSPQTDPDEQ